MNKKIKQNRYKPEVVKTDAARSDSRFDIDFCIKCIMTIAAISLISLASIFIYDFITQSNVFNVRNIEINGANRVEKQDIIKLSEIQTGKNIFEPNLFAIEKKIASHPWIQAVSIKRDLPAQIIITIIEQTPLAIVKIENIADILINTNGQPFKEYNPKTDNIKDLPVISGLDLTAKNSEYLFYGPLFNSIMDFMDISTLSEVYEVKGDKNTGIIIQSKDIYNKEGASESNRLEIKLGFNNFQAKLHRAKEISEYIDKHFPDRVICAMDLFNIEKVFIKTKRNDALHNTLEKGV